MSIKKKLAIVAISLVLIVIYMGAIHMTCKQAGTKTIVMGGNTIVCY